MAQGEAEFRDLPLRHFGGQDRLRAVEGAAPLVQFNRHVGLQQPLRINDGFIAVRIELGIFSGANVARLTSVGSSIFVDRRSA